MGKHNESLGWLSIYTKKYQRILGKGGATTLSITTLGLITLSVIGLIIRPLSISTECLNAACRFAKCRYAECFYAECRGALGERTRLHLLFLI